LRRQVADFIARVRSRPVLGSDPAELEALTRAVRESTMDGFAAESAPVAPYRWEQRIQFLGSQLQSNREQFVFPFGVEVLGYIPTIVSLDTPPGALAPTIDDIDVAIDVNQQQYVTNANGVTTPGGTQGGNFITLRTIQILDAALFRLQIVGVNPVMGFTLRWKRGANIYQDAIVGIGIVARPLYNIGTNVPAPAAGG